MGKKKRWTEKDFLKQDDDLDPVDLQQKINHICRKSKSVLPPEVLAILQTNKSCGKKSKHNNKQIMYDGYKWDSISERDYYIFLKHKKKANAIKDIEVKPMYKLQINGKLICKFYPDFGITYPDGSYVIHDVKGEWKGGITAVYSIKKKMLQAMRPELVIREAYKQKGGWKIT